MGGSSSASDTKQDTTNESLQASANANVAPVFQGQNVTQNTSFDVNAAGTVNAAVNGLVAANTQLIDLTRGAGDALTKTFQGLFALTAGEQAQVAKSSDAAVAAAQTAANPNLAVTNSYTPFVFAGLAAVIILTIIMGKKHHG